MRRLRTVLGGIIAVVVIIVLMVGAGSILDHSNPPVTYEVRWDSPQTQALARRACSDCHSNETQWPWYSYVAPAAFLVVHDVDDGRRQMNFSTGTRLDVQRMVEAVMRDQMPPFQYVILHPDAQLTSNEKQQLINGLRATFGG